MPSLRSLFVFLLLSLIIVLWHSHFAFIQFGGNDGGILANVAWSQYQGLSVYRDIPCYFPVLFAYPAGWAFDLWGPTWAALTHLVCVYSILTFAWTSALLWRATGRPYAALFFAFALQAIALFSLSWWWYNQVTSLILPIYLISVLFLFTEPASRFARISFWFAVALTAFAKPNTAGALLVATHLVLLLDRRTRIFVLLASSTAALADVVFLWLHHVTPLLLMQNYLQVGGRLFSITTLIYDLGLRQGSQVENREGLLLCGLLLVMLVHFFRLAGASLREKKLFLPFVGLFLGVLCTSLVGMVTNNDLKLNEITCFIAFIPFLALFFRETRLQSWVARGMVGGLTIFALGIGITRHRVYDIGPLFFFEFKPLTRLEEPPFFRGMAAGPILHGTLSDLEAWMKEEHLSPASSKKVFFGPRIDFAYAAFHLPVLAGIPFYWEHIPSTHHGEQWPAGPVPTSLSEPARWIREGEPLDPRVQRFIDAKFDYCVFLKGYDLLPDMSYMPPDVRAAVYEHYTLTYYGWIAVFTRK